MKSIGIYVDTELEGEKNVRDRQSSVKRGKEYEEMMVRRRKDEGKRRRPEKDERSGKEREVEIGRQRSL